MSESHRNSRRQFLSISLATVGAATIAPSFSLGKARRARAMPRRGFARAGVAAHAASLGHPAILAAAKTALERHGARIAHRDVACVADFGRPSSQPRLHLVDLASGHTQSLLVAHGRGSDPAHTGWLHRFSNAPGSDATSAGAFLTDRFYVGDHGPSLRLIGLDASNSNAEAREIVVHSAWYVGPGILHARGQLGRSEGCFAVSPQDLPRVLHRLGPGRLLVSTRL